METRGGSTGTRTARTELEEAQQSSPSIDQAARRRSLLRYAPAAVLLAAVLADSIQYADTDIWMHVRFGQFVLHTGHLLRRDIYSYSAPGAPWFNHEWLADVVIAAFYNAAGVFGLKLFKFACAFAVAALLAEGTAETGASYPIQLAVLLLAGLGLRLQIQFRPQLFDYIFLAALLALLNRDFRERRAPLWLAIPIMALWANLHGAFFTGIAVLALYTGVVGAQDRLAGLGGRRAMGLAALTLVALLATLLNPFGIRAWFIAIGKFREPIVAMNLVPEFQSLPQHIAAQGMTFVKGYLFAFGIVGAGIVAFLIAPSIDDLPIVAIAAMMTCGWIYAMRNMEFAVIAWTAPLARHMDLAVHKWKRTHSSDTEPVRAMASMRLQIPILAAAIFFALAGGIFSAQLPIARDFPVGAIAFMDRYGLQGNILVEYGWSSYVIWHEVPPSRVFFDSFDDRFPASVQRSYVDLLIGNKDQVAAMLNRYPHDFVLIPASWWQNQFLSGRPDWTLLYRDPVAVLFARANSPATKIPGLPEVHDSAPKSVFP